MRAAAPRWAISFADLGLILLGCFVMLHAIEAARPRPAAAAAGAARSTLADVAVAEWFEPGEARLTAIARSRLHRLAGRDRDAHWLVASRGLGEAGPRLDRFELAAARSAAVARALQEGGIGEGRLSLRLDEAAAGADGQRISIEQH